MTFEYNGLVWFQTIGLKETAVSDQSRFQANGGAVYNTPVWDKGEGVTGRNGREWYFPDKGASICPPGKSMIFH